MKKAHLNAMANAFALVVEVSEGLSVKIGNAEHPTFRLRDASGVLALQVPKQMFPFLQAGESCFITLSALRAEVVPTSSIIIPSNDEVN